ncbi:CRISPR-associated endonuclease Cas2 [Ectothiorhodospiraceae bacterium BW-2]|nr:CRISPR-associated endonuclease Cas2 [Ectothiorhodospiraceae bacterium BW-2]
MKSPQNFVVAYDVSSNRERSRISKLLEGYGFRAQKSLFEIRADKTTLRRLTRALQALNLTSGFARIYPLGYRVAPVSIGEAPPASDADSLYLC